MTKEPPNEALSAEMPSIASMTGYGRAETAAPQAARGVLVWELRSVNHRHLDVSWRLPDSFSVLEMECRELLGQTIKRGKIDACLRFQSQSQALKFTVNQPLVAALNDAADDIAQQMIGAGGLSMADIMRWPGVLEAGAVDHDAVQEQALQLFEQAVFRLQETRQAEGRRIAELFDARLERMANYVSEVRDWQPELRQRLQDRLQQRLSELAVDVDPGRLEQELALQLQKIDVAEELDRLDAHINDFDQALTVAGPVGQRLNFISQEMNREANTLAAKSQGLVQTQAAIELKVLIEQIREQVQNVE